MKRYRILVLDEAPGVCGIVADALAVCNSEIRFAHSAESALGQVSEFQPDLLIADARRLDSDGIDLMRIMRESPFIPVSCGAVPGSLKESGFFGHVKGSFTGADADRPGYFEAARGGTLFLDEIGDAPLELQIAVLRVLQEREYMPIGSTVGRKTDARFIAATTEILEEPAADEEGCDPSSAAQPPMTVQQSSPDETPFDAMWGEESLETLRLSSISDDGIPGVPGRCEAVAIFSAITVVGWVGSKWGAIHVLTAMTTVTPPPASAVAWAVFFSLTAGAGAAFAVASYIECMEEEP
jgi:hypothetical protein